MLLLKLALAFLFEAIEPIGCLIVERTETEMSD
jgi:hypothetical protein